MHFKRRKKPFKSLQAGVLLRSRFGFCTQNTLLFYELQAVLYDLVNMPVLWTGFICIWFPV